MDNVLERVNNKFIDIGKSFEIINNDILSLHDRIDKINNFIDIYNFFNYDKINKSISLENSNISKTHLFICEKYLDINLKKDSIILFQFLSDFDKYLDINVKFKLKFFDIIDEEIDYKIEGETLKFNHEFTLPFNITNLHFSLYMNFPYNIDLKIWKYINEILMINKKINLCIYSKL